MTAPTIRRPAVATRRYAAVYGIPTLVVDDAGQIVGGLVVVGYVGKTRQRVKQREIQHRDERPFSDLIVGGSWAIEEGFWTDAELNDREAYYIRRGAVLVPGQEPQRPVYNYEHNLGNPQRIEIWRAEQHRQAREPEWVPPVKGGRIPQQRRQPGFQSPARPRASRRIRWTRGRVRFVCWAALWAAVAVISGGWTAASAVATARDGFVVGVGAASVAVGGLLYSRRPKRRRRSSRRGRW